MRCLRGSRQALETLPMISILDSARHVIQADRSGFGLFQYIPFGFDFILARKSVLRPG